MFHRCCPGDTDVPSVLLLSALMARAGVGVGTVYRRFAGKDALIDELLRLANHPARARRARRAAAQRRARGGGAAALAVLELTPRMDTKERALCHVLAHG
jgi:AcrR family transcriptional regulator